MEYKLATSTWGKEEINAIQEVIDTDKFSMGPKVEEYEKQFALLFGSKYGVMCSSGSTANLLMVASLFFSKKYVVLRKNGFFFVQKNDEFQSILMIFTDFSHFGAHGPRGPIFLLF